MTDASIVMIMENVNHVTIEVIIDVDVLFISTEYSMPRLSQKTR
jgi:hypothetical protein